MHTSLWRYDLADSTHHVVFNPEGTRIIQSFAPSRDGRRIAFTTGYATGSGGSASKILSLTTGEIRDLPSTGPGRSAAYGGLNWTPDGQLIGTQRREADGMIELWRIPIDGGAPRKLGFESKSLTNLRLNPDGRRLAFGFAGDEGDSGVWVIENFLPPLQQKPKQ